ncbi:hypothetical protein EVAR_9918_1 [Eumeta japonica]|uniref:Uncharacterized protein n=1 Tax=Eumeta variegata TaxID=151549 RepID=A0A4C1TQG0_EUMVA|nr:hypothetical protein EVAR_9918_1 [Eumeta japonica]
MMTSRQRQHNGHGASHRPLDVTHVASLRKRSRAVPTAECFGPSAHGSTLRRGNIVTDEVNPRCAWVGFINKNVNVKSGGLRQRTAPRRPRCRSAVIRDDVTRRDTANNEP